MSLGRRSGSTRDSVPPTEDRPAAADGSDNNPNVPTVLFNGMVAPLVPFAIKGAIWYQGESNAGRREQYRTLLPTMIRDWRSRFTSADGQFPFFIVQLAAFMDETPEPGESPWAELREAQDLTARDGRPSAIAVATDIGDAKDIHPHNKQEVGRRLALERRGHGLWRKSRVLRPRLQGTCEVTGDAAVLHFDHLGGGLEAKGGGALAGLRGRRRGRKSSSGPTRRSRATRSS